jgi:hypothetical protein
MVRGGFRKRPYNPAARKNARRSVSHRPTPTGSACRNKRCPRPTAAGPTAGTSAASAATGRSRPARSAADEASHEEEAPAPARAPAPFAPAAGAGAAAAAAAVSATRVALAARQSR